MAGRPRLLLAAVAALLWVAARTPAALAHAILIRADPPDLCAPFAVPRVPAGDHRCVTGPVLTGPPASVHLFFNERVQLVGRGIRVFSPTGRRADRGPVRVDGPQMTVALDAAEDGTYLVTWRVVSGDTHPVLGTFAFSVAHASAPPGGVSGAGGAAAGSSLGLLLQVLARAAHFAGYALGFGAVTFQAVVLRPLGLGVPEAERRVWRLVGLGVVLLLGAEPLALLAQTTSLGTGAGGPLDPDVVGGALDSSFGRVLAQRLGAALLLWVLLGAARDASARATGAVAILGMALAFVDGEAAHAVGVRPVWLGMSLNALHVAAMGVWLGGVAALLSLWRLSRGTGRQRELVARLSRVAATALGILAVTGTVMAVQHLAAPADLLATPYGRTLTAKLGVLLVVLLMALTASRSSEAHRAPWWSREAAALLAVLIFAGLLVSLPPPV